MDRDVVIVGAGVVGAAIARELTRYELDVTLLEARPGRGRRHQQGEHRAAAHRLRRQAGHARGAPGRARLRAAVRVRAGAPASRSSAPARCWWPGTSSSAASSPGSSSARARTATTRSASSTATSSTGASRSLGPGALGALEVPDEGLDLPLHHAARLRHRGGAGGLRAAPRRGRHRRRAAARRRLSRGGRRRLADRPPAGQRGRPAQRRDRPHARRRALHGHAAARRADRVRQALAPARAPRSCWPCRRRCRRACWCRPRCSAT